MQPLEIPKDKSPIEYVFGDLAPEHGAAAGNFSKAVYENTSIPLSEFEVARMRIAQINDCLLCLNYRSSRDGEASPEEELYGKVADWKHSSLTEREKLAAEYAELFATRHLTIDENFWQRMKGAFSESEIAELSFCIASWLGLGRINQVLGIDRECEI